MKNEQNLHLIISNDNFLIDQKITQICQENQIIATKSNIFKYYWNSKKDFFINLQNDLITNVFFDKKIIVLHCNDMKDKWDKNQNNIFNLLLNAQHYIFLIFEKKKENEFIQKIKEKRLVITHQVGKFSKLRKNKYIIKTLNEHYVRYEPEVLDYLNENLANDLELVKNEIEKIIAYFHKNQQTITKSSCQKIINVYKEGSFFVFIEALLKGNKKEIISSYQNLKTPDINPLIFISTILTYVLFLKKLNTYQKQNKQLAEIIKLSKKSYFFILNLTRILKNTTEKQINILILKMYELEYHVKMSEWKEKILLEFFLIK